jgi:hypothetical protein
MFFICSHDQKRVKQRIGAAENGAFRQYVKFRRKALANKTGNLFAGIPMLSRSFLQCLD